MKTFSLQEATDIENRDTIDKENVPPSQRFFGAKIKGHPDNLKEKLEKRKSRNSEEFLSSDEGLLSAEVLLEGGVVKGILVDPEVLDQIDRNRVRYDTACMCCHDRNHEISFLLRTDLKVQGIFLLKLLMLENALHIPPILWLLIQMHVEQIHDFIYEQWLLCTLFIATLFIILIWSIVLTNLPRHHPADDVLLFIKAVFFSQLSATTTALIEKGMQIWQIKDEDIKDSGSLENLKITLKGKDAFTHPFIVLLFLVQNTIMYTLMGLYFYVFKANVRKDRIFGIGIAIQVALISLTLVIKLVDKGGIKMFVGPDPWDYGQIVVTTFLATTWQQWRLYNLTELLCGRKCAITEKEFRVEALMFTII